MEKFNLEQVRIAAPCSVPWDSMQGDSRKRFCDQCQLHVYNISDMSRKVAEEFLQKEQGRVCINMFKREDGTILTQDCPVGLRAIRRKFQKMMILVGSLVVSVLMGIGLYQKISKSGVQSNFLKKILNKQPEPEPLHRLAGEVCVPATTPTPPSATTTTSGVSSQEEVKQEEVKEETKVIESKGK